MMAGTRQHLLRLAERRARLQERARAEREALAVLIARGDEVAALLQRARGILDELLRQPWLVAAGVAFLVALRPRRMFSWAMRGWGAWRMARSAVRWWRQFAAQNADTRNAA